MRKVKMKLNELDPSFYSTGGEGITSALTGKPVPERKGIGLCFRCPCGCDDTICIPFSNPIDGGPSVIDGVGYKTGWKRTGDTMDALTLSPSIFRKGGCRWHGFIENGNIRTV